MAKRGRPAGATSWTGNPVNVAGASRFEPDGVLARRGP